MVLYIAHGMLLEATYLEEAGEDELAAIRRDQAETLFRAYDFTLPKDPTNIAAADPEKNILLGGISDEPPDVDVLFNLLR